MSETVYIVDRRYLFRLQWSCDGEEGACLGEETYKERDFEQAATRDNGDRWFIAATLDVGAMDPKPKRDSDGYYFETRTEATKALRIARAAKKRKGPMPDWAIAATAAGWKAPKGWVP